jgi:hypothetical protein
MDWIEAVGARSTGERPFGGSMVAGIEFPLRRWGPVSDANRYMRKRNSLVYPLDGREPKPSCQEVEVAKQLRIVRDEAFWFSEYPGMEAIWRPWASRLRAAPDWLASLDKAIREQISSPRGGMPDVVAWSDFDPFGSAILVECKGRGESFKEAQEDWVRAALKSGIGPTQIAVAILPS